MQHDLIVYLRYEQLMLGHAKNRIKMPKQKPGVLCNGMAMDASSLGILWTARGGFAFETRMMMRKSKTEVKLLTDFCVAN